MDLTTPGERGASLYEERGIHEQGERGDLGERGAGLGDIGGLDIGLRLEDLRLDWSLAPDSSVWVSASRDRGAGRGLRLLRDLGGVSARPRILLRCLMLRMSQ